MPLLDRTVVVAHTSETSGLRMRDASSLCRIASQFACHVTIRSGATHVDAKSVISLTLLKIGRDKMLRVFAEGDDAKAALRAIANFFAHGLLKQVPPKSQVTPEAQPVELQHLPVVVAMNEGARRSAS